MEEIEQAIEQTLHQVPEKNRDEFKRTAITLAKLRLERGDSISSIVDFILS